MTAPAPEDLSGRRLPGGTCRVEGYESLLLHDAVRAPRTEAPHPIWAFLAPQRGMGMSLAALFEGFGCRLHEGPLLGRFGARFVAPLALDVDHEVRGGITTVQRRRGRVLGVVDKVEMVLDLRRDDTLVLTATYGFLLPRPGVTDAPPSVGTTEAPAGSREHRRIEHRGPSITVRADEMKLLALLLRDPNPIHLDPDAAAAVGLGRACVNQGPANLAYALTHVTGRRPDVTLRAFDARFRATVVAGDVVTPVARDDGGFALRHANGRDAVIGTAEL